MYEEPFGRSRRRVRRVTIVVDASVALRWCFQLNGSDRAEKLLLSDDRLIAPDLVIAEIANAVWKFVTFDRITAKSAISAVREVVKAFEELVPTSGLRDRALAIAIELRHPAYDCFYLALAERNTSPLVTADDRLIRRVPARLLKSSCNRFDNSCAIEVVNGWSLGRLVVKTASTRGSFTQVWQHLLKLIAKRSAHVVPACRRAFRSRRSFSLPGLTTL